MSGNAALLPCPVCLHAVFQSSDSLRDRLIFVSTNKLLCPVCQEEVAGIDKLTIHLFSHVKLATGKTYTAANEVPKQAKAKSKVENQSAQCTQNKKSRSTVVKNKSPTTSTAPVKFVKIYPKLPVVSLNSVPVLENSLYIPAVKSETTLVQSNTTCNVCGIQFVDVNILKMHKCLIHNIDENANTTVTRYQCRTCPKVFKMRGSLMVHMRVAHYGFTSNSNDNETNGNKETTTSNPNIKQISDAAVCVERNDNKQWQCDVCRKCFTTKYFLKKHKRLHTGETPYACGQCNKMFTFQQSYHKHLLYHNDEKPHICTYCGRAFKELSTLHNHQRIHTGEKPFSCETCGKCFRQRVSYLVHRRIHTGVMPYKCTACDKSFRYKVSQRTHKCQAQPPGTVVRQTGELVEKLKKKLPNITAKGSIIEDRHSILYPVISEANAELVRTGAKLSLEDTEKDDFVLIESSFQECKLKKIDNNIVKKSEDDFGKRHDIYVNTTIEDLIETIPNDNDKQTPSPSEIFKNLCLSPESDRTRQEGNSDVNYQDFLKDFHDFLQ